MKNLFKNKKGFTLIELIVVIAIIGILVMIAAPRFLGYTKDANVATMQADAKVLANAALVYNIENEGSWPVEEDEETIKINEVDVKAKALKEAELKDHVQTLKNDIENYKLVTADTTVNDVELKEGDIIYVKDGKGIQDRAGNTHYGVNLEIKKGE